MQMKTKEIGSVGDVIRGLQKAAGEFISDFIESLNFSCEPVAANNDEVDVFCEEQLLKDTRPTWKKLLFMYDPEEEEIEDQLYCENDIIDFDSIRLSANTKLDELSKSKNNA